MRPELDKVPAMDSGLIVLACVVVAIVGVVGFGMILKFLRDLRRGLADELKREIASGREAAPVSVQQPLSVSPHDPFVPLSQHTALRVEFQALAEQRRKDISGLHTKIEQGLTGVRQDIAAEFKEVRETQVDAREEIAVLKNETTSQTRQLFALDSKIENLPEKIFRLMNHEKKS